MEILFESKLLLCVDANGITISSFLGAGACSLALKKALSIIVKEQLHESNHVFSSDNH